jgi:Flp pilus assembly protein TadD
MMRRFDEARADLDRAVALDPQCVSARLNRATLFVFQGKVADASAELNALVSHPNPPAEAIFARGQLQLLTADPSAALASLDVALGIQPSLAPAHLMRAKSHLELGERSSATKDLDAFFTATGMAPSDPATAAAQRGHLLRLIASQLSPSGRKHAIEMGLAELKIATASPAASASAFADLGGLLALQKNFEQSAAASTRAIKLAPDDPQVLINRGWQWVNLNRDREAQADFAAALKLAPKNSEALTGIGYVDARQNRHFDAERHAALALLGGADDYMILHNVACIYAELSRVDNARQAEREDAALAMLERAVSLWRQAQGGPDEMQLIQNESAFSVSFRQRAIQRLGAGQNL